MKTINTNNYRFLENKELTAAELKEYHKACNKARAELKQINRERAKKGLPPRKSIIVKGKLRWGKIDNNYQRLVKVTEVTTITTEYNVDKIGVIVVSARDDGAYIADGQHRWYSSYENGEEEVYYLMYFDLTTEEESALFSEQDDNSTTPSRVIKLRADHYGKKQYALDIVNACESRGFVLRFPGVATGTARNINAVSMLIDIYNRYGLIGLENGLDLMLEAGWGDYDEMCKHVFLSMAYTINSILRKTHQEKGGAAWNAIVKQMSKGRPGAFLGAAHIFADNDDNKGNMHSDEKALKEYMIYLAK